MITINGTTLQFVYMGLFNRYGEWTHPTVTVSTFELIFVTEGQMYIREGEHAYHVQKGDLLLLDPDVEHGGIRPSFGRTSFYWLHYKADQAHKLPFPKLSRPDAAKVERRLKEIMQYQMTSNTTMAELMLARFLLEGRETSVQKNKLAHEIAEYIRMSASRALTVEEIAGHFGYAPDHVSRLTRAEFGIGAKAMIIEKRLEHIEAQLVNTNDKIVDIALRSGFESENALLKFFKHHTGKTPTQFRNEFYGIHMNEK